MSFFAYFATLEIGEKHKSTPLDIWHPAMKVAFLRGRDFHIPFRLWKFRNLVCRFKKLYSFLPWRQVHVWIPKFAFEPVSSQIVWTHQCDFWNFTSENEREKTALRLFWAFLLKGQRFHVPFRLWKIRYLICRFLKKTYSFLLWQVHFECQNVLLNLSADQIFELTNECDFWTISWKNLARFLKQVQKICWKVVYIFRRAFQSNAISETLQAKMNRKKLPFGYFDLSKGQKFSRSFSLVKIQISHL